MPKPIKYTLPPLILGRVYRSTRIGKPNVASQFYRIEEKLSEEFYRVTSHTPGSRFRASHKACTANTLRTCALVLVDFDQEPEALQSEEGARLRAERKRAARAERPSASGQRGLAGHRPVGMALPTDLWPEIDAYLADQQRRASASGLDTKITMAEALRCLVRRGLDAWRSEAASTPAPSASIPSNGKALGFHSP